MAKSCLNLAMFCYFLIYLRVEKCNLKLTNEII